MHYEVGTVHVGNVALECGETRECRIAYELVSEQPLTDQPLILICHALTGNQYAFGPDGQGWWSNFIGKGKMLDTQHFAILSTNVIGGCNGTDIEQGERGYPALTVRDMVHAQYAFLQRFDQRIAAVIGGSLGGMQVWEWAVMYPRAADWYIPLAATPSLSAYAIAFNHIAEQAIEADRRRRMDLESNKQDSASTEAVSGLEIARMVGMITYRSAEMFNRRFGRQRRTEKLFQIQSYLDYQGKKLKSRFDEQSYLTLLRAMNSHDITRGRGSLKEVLERIQTRILLGAFQDDLLYPPREMERTAQLLRELGKDVSYFQVETLYGHDGFLVEADKWQEHVRQVLRETLCVEPYEYRRESVR